MGQNRCKRHRSGVFYTKILCILANAVFTADEILGFLHHLRGYFTQHCTIVRGLRSAISLAHPLPAPNRNCSVNATFEGWLYFFSQIHDVMSALLHCAADLHLYKSEGGCKGIF